MCLALRGEVQAETFTGESSAHKWYSKPQVAWDHIGTECIHTKEKRAKGGALTFFRI